MWVSSSDVRPVEPGWYPALSQWGGINSYVPCAYEWLGDRWRSSVPERIVFFLQETLPDRLQALNSAYANERTIPACLP